MQQTPPISTAPVLRASNAGHGDAVYLWTGGAADWTMTHAGEANFIVTEYGQGLLDINPMVNEIGKYKGTVPANEGPAVATIQADGAWTLKTS